MNDSTLSNLDVDEYGRQVAARLRDAKVRIARACARVGRDVNEVTVVCVTKYVGAASPFVPALLNAGARDFGENRMKSLLEKHERFGETFGDSGTNTAIRWHYIGALQENKIRKIVSRVALIHSIDSLKLLAAVDRIAEEERRERRVDVLLEVKISEDATKLGFTPDNIPVQVAEAARFSHIRLCGLMGMGGLSVGEEETRNEFARLKRLFDRCAELVPDRRDFTRLSMGMSHDFEIAVEEGATMVRIGSMLYPDFA